MKLRYTFTTALVLILFISTSALHASTSTNTSAAPVVNTVPDDVEFAVLKKFYDSLGGSAWTTKTNWPAAGAWPTTATSAQFATWYGVTVTNGDVSGITFANKNLIGKLPSNLGDLKALVTLNLNTNNGITGTVPTTLTTLPVLQDLILYRCSLTGSVSAGLFNNLNLKNLNFSYNNMTGTIPANIGNAPNLITLVLASNNLTGTIPTSVGSLVNLTQLLLWGNQLTGTIPTGVGNCTKLTSLQLQTNLLTGSIPSELGALTQLTGLYLFGNQLTGALPASMASLTKLQVLSLYSNSLSGPIPAWLGNFNALLSLYLYSNQFSGSIPASLGQLTKLNNLSLNNNQLTGNIPAELGTLAAMQNLNLQGNQLSGSLPSTLGNLSKLLYLYANDNQLSGTLPSQLGNLSLLRILYLYNNQLTGELPASLTALSQLTNFNVTNNQLSGTLPSGYFSSWTNLVNGQLGGNQFSGAFPSVINCTKLTTLVCQNNFFTSLPADVNSLPLLNYLSFTNNLLTSVASLNTQVNKASLSLYLQNNQLDFSQLETLPGSGIKTMYLVPQKDITDVAAVNLVVGSSLVLTTRPAGNNSTVTWEKQNPDGTWLTLTNDQDAVATTYTRSAATLGDQGTYRWKMTNTVVTKITLQSGPMAVASMQQQVLDQWTFQYDYDARQRMIGKKVPGADWVYLVYDNRDRLVFTQDGNQRILNQWTYSQYDALNRPIISGLYTHTSFLDQTGMSNLISTMQYAETYTGNAANHGYTQTVFSTTTFPGTFVPLTITYYDNYDFKTLLNASQFNYQSTDYDEQYKSDAAGNSFTSVIGQVTGTKVKVLGQEKFLWNVNYYDDKYRVVQTISTNARDGIDRTTNVYDFVGKVLQSKTVHNITATPQTIARTFDYDHAGRLNWVKHSVNGATPIVLFENQYNELGQLVTKKLHSANGGSTFKQQEDYRYNIRGWLTRINNADLNNTDGGPRDYFGMEFGYTNDLGVGTFTPQYNGNISATKWSANLGLGLSYLNEPTERAYTFKYDPMNRFVSANHFLKSSTWRESLAHQESARYDLNGNVQSLYRNNSNGASMDGLVYNYGAANTRSNRLLWVADNGITSEGFKDGNTTGDDYGYDANGNVVRDKNKAIDSIKYNTYLNQSEEILNDNHDRVTYTYDAEGVKLSEEIFVAGSTTPTKRTDFAGPFVYENDTLKFILHDEGKIVIPKGASEAPEYQYQMKDHLGNIRLTFTAKEQTDVFKATMEDTGVADYSNPRVEEMAHFANLFETEIRNVNQWLNHTSNASGNAIYLDGTEEKTIGPYTMLKVYPGDTVTMAVFGKYEKKSAYNTTAVATLLASLAVPVQSAALSIDGLSTISSSSLIDGLTPFMVSKGSSTSAPDLYLNYILFDKDLGVADLGFDHIDESAGFDPAGENTVLFDTLQLHRIIDRAGYLYVYVSNESPGTRVWFDDLTIAYSHSPIVQFEDYYPFGLSMSSTAFDRSNATYKGMVTTEGTGLKDLGFRQYDAALGRFHAVDPLAELQLANSTYQYAGNNPVGQVDVLGLELEGVFTRKDKDKKDTSKRKQHKEEKSVNGKKVKVIIGFDRPKDTRKNTHTTSAPGTEEKTKGTTKTDGGKNVVHKKESTKSGQTGPQVFLVSGPPLGAGHDDKKSSTGNENGNNESPGLVNSVTPPSVDSDTREDGMLPVVESYEKGNQATDPEQYRRYLFSRHSANEARALYQRMLSRNYNYQSTRFGQNIGVRTNTLGSDHVFAGPGTPIEVILANNGIPLTYKLVDALLKALTVEINLTQDNTLLNVTAVKVSSASFSEDSPELMQLVKRGADYAEQLLKEAEKTLPNHGFTNKDDIRKFVLDHQAAIQKHLEELRDAVTSGDVHDFTAISEQEKQGLQNSVDKFKNEQGIAAEVKILDKEFFDRLKAQYDNGTRKPEKDVTLLLTTDDNGNLEKHFVYKEGMFVMPTEKVLPETQETIQLTGTIEEVKTYRDQYIDKAIEDNTLEGIQVDPQFKNLNIFEKGMWVIKVTQSLLKEVTIKDEYWNSKSEEKNPLPFYVNDVLAGGGNVAIDELKSVPDMISMGLSVFDKEVRESLVKAVSEVSWDQVSTGLSGMFNDHVSKYTSDNREIVTYQASADGATVIIALLTAGEKLVTKVKDIIGDVKKLSKIDWKTINLPKAKNKKLAGDITGNKALEDAITADPKLAKAWNKLDEAGVDDLARKDVTLLKNTNDWDANGVSVTPDAAQKKLDLVGSDGSKIAEVSPDGKLLPEKYDFDPATGKPNPGGTAIGEPQNGYQTYKNGNDVSVRRVPDKTGYSQSELSELTDHPDAHVLERHGHDVTDEALIKRSQEGIAPDGANTGRPTYSSRFDSPDRLKEALENVKPGTPAFSARVKDPSTGFWIVEHPGNFGVGYSQNVNNGLIKMNKVTAVFEEVSPNNFKLLTMYPNK